MAVILTRCECPQPSGLVDICGEPTVVESSTCLATPIPDAATDFEVSFPETLPTDTLAIELVCCNLVVVCGYITKRISYRLPGRTTTETTTINVPIQAHVRLHEGSDILLTPQNLSITSARVCSGCYRLLCPTLTAAGIVYNKIREKEILEFVFTYTPDAA